MMLQLGGESCLMLCSVHVKSCGSMSPNTWIWQNKHACQIPLLWHPTIMAPFPSDINQFPLIFPDKLQSIIVDNGEWDLYLANV